jgi:molecular chaperone GrpE
MGQAMRSGWDKVTRWAGIGDNKRDATKGSKAEMVDEMKDGAEAAEVVVDRVEAGMETPVEVDALQEAQAELVQLKGERDMLIDRLARLQAEFDNARKREAKERQDAREYTIGNTVEPFLGVMDNFQLALGAEGSVEQLRSGVGLILKQMEDALKSLQVTAVETVGTQFDPRIHEALGSIETAKHPDHQVLEEIRRGYKVRERLLRPAMVKIAVNKAVVSD